MTIVLMSLLSMGCESTDERLVRQAEEAAARQAQQNELVAKQSQSVAEQGQRIAETARELVQQDAAARRELVQAHEQARAELQTERTSLNDQRERLEQERQAIAAARQRDPIIAEAIGAAALLLAALLPLLLAAYALRQLGSGSTEEAVKETLVRELVEGPLLSQTPPPAISDGGADRPRLEQDHPEAP